MRTTSKRRKATAGPVPQKIRIEFHAEHAQQVRLAGTFNDWRPDATPMLALGEGS
jgi:Carbohydrate-binding module 48 (Isoamylase N-terminal domain)